MPRACHTCCLGPISFPSLFIVLQSSVIMQTISFSRDKLYSNSHCFSTYKQASVVIEFLILINPRFHISRWWWTLVFIKCLFEKVLHQSKLTQFFVPFFKNCCISFRSISPELSQYITTFSLLQPMQMMEQIFWN